MSALWFKLVTILCLPCTALSDPESGGVVWRDLGGAFTVQCRPPESEPAQEFLTLEKGLSEDLRVLYKESNKNTIAPEFSDRLQLNGVFPNVDILIKNLTSYDIGPYWCKYQRFDQTTSQPVIMKGKGSVLLVVTDADTPQHCESSSKNLVLVPVVISAVVLFGLILIFLIWITRKTTTLRTTVKPRHTTTNDVYEDMRGTLRR